MESSDYEKFSELNDLFLFLDSVIPDGSSADEGTPVRGIKRYLTNLQCPVWNLG